MILRLRLPSYFAVAWVATLTSLVLTGCSGKRAKTAPELSQLEGKKVALVEVQGESTARSIVEVALINQLIRTGSFEIISKQEIEKAKTSVDVDSSDWQAVARKTGADYALRAKVLAFSAEIQKGFSEEEIEDSQLEAETGNAKTKRIYPVKRLDGNVEVELTFTDISPNGKGETRSGIARRSESVTSEARRTAAHLPPKLRFLEKLSNEAFHEFFEKNR